MKNILLAYNKKNREKDYLKLIKKEIENTNEYKVILLPRTPSAKFIFNVFKYRPKSILTFPFTAKGSSPIFYILKFIFKFKLVTLRTEGVMYYDSPRNIKWHLGNENYGKNLIDLEIFWGDKQREVLGKHLLINNKIENKDRLITIGYPRIELTERISENKNIPKGYLLFATGFHLADYTKKTIISAKDIPTDKESFDYSLDAIEISKKLRSKFIKEIDATAALSDSLFYIKIHPIEKKENYIFKNFNSNIIVIKDEYTISELVRNCDFFFHYGSTTLIDAYLHNKPSFYYYYKESKTYYPDLNWPNNKILNLDSLKEFILNNEMNQFKFKLSKEIKDVLKEEFNYSFSKTYKPSKEIASRLLSKSKLLKISLFDKYLWFSVFKSFTLLFGYLSRELQK